jgi:hypothetical protein
MSRSATVAGSPNKPNPDLAIPREGSADYSLVRSARRFVPKGIVTVSVGEGGFPLAFGQVRDISESGACMVTDFVLGRGRTLSLELKFDDRLRLETDAQIVWSGEGKDWQGAIVGAVLQGVEFTNLPETLRQQLRDLLSSGAFELVPAAGQVCGVRANPFQEVLEALQPDLDQLGVKVSPS